MELLYDSIENYINYEGMFMKSGKKYNCIIFIMLVIFLFTLVYVGSFLNFVEDEPAIAKEALDGSSYDQKDNKIETNAHGDIVENLLMKTL